MQLSISECTVMRFALSKVLALAKGRSYEYMHLA